MGRILPGIEHRLEPVENGEGGVLVVRGPNVMIGSIGPAKPDLIETPQDGWYNTGDIVSLDADGFMSIIGRAKRFAKPGGERISLDGCEELAHACWPHAQHAVIAVPDARKGEALVLVTTQPDATARSLLDFARGRGLAEIMVPRNVQVVKAVPLLGSGKVKYPAVAVCVAELAEPK